MVTTHKYNKKERQIAREIGDLQTKLGYHRRRIREMEVEIKDFHTRRIKETEDKILVLKTSLGGKYGN